MNRALRSLFLHAAVAATGPSSLLASVSIGDRAPPVEPVKWLNLKGMEKISWRKLRGRLILVERWSTRSSASRRSIPHLDALARKYGRRGLTIVAVTDEPARQVEPFVEKMGLKYIVAIRGAREYTCRAIPQAWLINHRGICVWKGHPASLKESTVEEHIRGAKPACSFKLTGKLGQASYHLERGRYGSGIRVLHEYLERPRSQPRSNEVETEARRALEDVLDLGKARLEEAERSIQQRDYDDALMLLVSVKDGFTGHALSAKARQKLDVLKAKRSLRVELAAARIINKARALLDDGNYEESVVLLRIVAQRKRYAGTRMQTKARSLFRWVRRYGAKIGR